MRTIVELPLDHSREGDEGTVDGKVDEAGQIKMAYLKWGMPGDVDDPENLETSW